MLEICSKFRISDLLRISSFGFRISLPECPIFRVMLPVQPCLTPHALFDEMNRIPQSSPTMRRLLGICLAIVTTTLATLGQTNPPVNSRQLFLQDCIEMTLKHNLDLKIDRYNPELQLFTLGAYYGYYDPTLNLSGQHDHSLSGSQLVQGGFSVGASKRDDNTFSGTLSGFLPSGASYTFGTLNSIFDAYGVQRSGTNIITPFENSGGNVGITATQPLLRNLWIDQNRLNIRVGKNRLKYSNEGLRLQIMQIITSLEQAYYDLIYNRENVLVQEKAVELAERLVAENRKKLEVGTLAPLDLQSAEAQAATSRANVIAAQAQLGTQERVLKGLITEEYLNWASLELIPTATLTAQPPIVNLQDSWSKGLTQRPDIVQSKLDVERAGIQLKYDRNQLFPQLDAFATGGYAGAGKEFSDALHNIEERNLPFYTFGGRFSFPLSNTSARNNYKSAKATLEQLVLTLKRLEQNIMIQIDNDIGNIRADFDQVHATRTAREYQESALDAEQKK